MLIEAAKAPVPGDIRTCFTQLVGAPMEGDMLRKENVALIMKLRTSEVAKSKCGKRLLALYDAK